MTKAERIHLLLVDWHLAREPGVLLSVGGDGYGSPKMPPMWNWSYQELERCVKKLRYAHDVPFGTFNAFQQRYFTCQTVRKNVKYRPGGKGEPVYEGLAANEAVVTSQLRTDADPLGRRPRKTNGRLPALMIEAIVQRWREDTDPRRIEIALAWLAREFRGEPYLPRWDDRARVAAS